MKTVRASYLGALASFGVASCCVLPVMLMLAGVGGGGLALFGPLAAASVWVLPTATLLLVAAWAVAFRRGALRRLAWKLGGSTVLMAAAWGIFVGEGRINDALIGLTQ